MATKYNFIWLMISLFFVVLLVMVINAWRKHDDALGRKLRGLGSPEQPPFDAEMAKKVAHAQYKGETLTKALEEIDLKLHLSALAAETFVRYRKSRDFARQLMLAITAVLVTGAVYGLFRFFISR
jgi:hypothetical protein